MIEKSSVVFANHDDEDIVCDVRFRPGTGRQAVVVIFHSFMAFKDWGWFPLAGERIADAGFTAVICNFSRNGVKENANRITDFEAFRHNTISHELADAQIVLDRVSQGAIRAVDSARLAVLGHSRGGGIAILAAEQSDSVKALVTWSSVATFDRWTPHQKGQWRKLGFLPLSRDTAASPLRLGAESLEDLEHNHESLDLLRAAAHLHKPWLLVHGQEDVVVRFSEAEQLYAATDHGITDFLALPHAGHTYGGSDFKADSRIHDVLHRTIHWLKDHV